MSILNKFSLKGKKALITGPEYLYGPEIAIGLCEAGAKVWLAGEQAGEMQSVAGEMEKAGFRAEGLLPYRQGSMAAAVQLAEAVRKELGTLDIFVENNGNEFTKGWDHSYEEICANLQRNQAGLLYTVQQLGVLMSEQKKGSVLLISDVYALVGCDVHHYDEAPELFDEAFCFEYGYVKGSCVNYARQAANFLGKYNARCNCIACGPMEGRTVKAYADRFIRHAQVKRLASADDIKAMAVFLASDASAYVTGNTFPVDGGYVAK